MNKRNYRQQYITPEVFKWHFQTGTLYEGFVIGEGYAWVSYNCIFVQDYTMTPHKSVAGLRTSTGISCQTQHLDTSPECVALSLGAEESLLQPDFDELPPRNSHYEGEVWGDNDKFLFVGTRNGGWECYYKGILSRKVSEVLADVTVGSEKKYNSEEPLLVKVWNSRAVSLITGDRIGFSVTISAGTGFGALTEGGIEIILRGPDAGIYLQPFQSVGLFGEAGGGGGVSISAERSYFLGETKDMKLSTLNGADIFAGMDVKTPYGGIGGEIATSSTFFIEKGDKRFKSWLTVGANVGVGAETAVKAGVKYTFQRIGVGFDGRVRYVSVFENNKE